MLYTGEIEVSQEVSQIEEITPETIGKLLQKAKDAEWRYLLKLRQWARQGSAYDDVAEYEVVYGEAEEVILERWNPGFPYAAGEDVLIIPKKVPTIVVWRHYEDTGNGPISRKVVYVFTRDGWKSVEV
jgi:hypothetical protein